MGKGLNESNEHEKDSNRDEAVECWLHNEVAAAYDALRESPSRAVTSEQVRAALAAQGEMEQAEGLRLSRADQESFAAALLSAPAPNESLDRAYERRSRLLRSE